jgi:tetratricopeptide (TPR) repeat protein
MEAETKQTPAEQTIDLYKLAAWAYDKRKPLIAIVTVVAVAAIVIGINNWRRGENEARANEMLFRLPAVMASGENAARPSPADLMAIANAYPSSSIGLQSELLANEALFTQGKYQEALTGFSKFLSSHSSSPFAVQASVGIAACQEGLGHTKEAIESYKQVIAQYSATGLTSPVKLTLARLFEEEKQFDQALSYYNELTSSPIISPNDPWGAEASERKSALLAQHPELNKSGASASVPTATPAPSLEAPAKTK